MAKDDKNNGVDLEPFVTEEQLQKLMEPPPKPTRVSVCLGCSDEGQTGNNCVLCGKEVIVALKCLGCGHLTKDDGEVYFCPDCGKPF